MISVPGSEELILLEIEAFLAASESVRFEGQSRTERCRWVERLLCRHEYPTQSRRAKGADRQLRQDRHRSPRTYAPADIELLAMVDRAHESLSGPATRHILKREFEVYGKPEIERLATLSNGHLYNLRRNPRYRERLRHYHKTRLAPEGRPGLLRIDTVHQGNRPSNKGIYHINAVDQVTQWEIVQATPRRSKERHNPTPNRGWK